MRAFLWLVLPVVGVFAAAVLLIRAQPYDDRELRAFFAPEGCPAPCFMGIQPGVTSVAEAVAILETHPWVGNLEILSDTEFRAGLLAWIWSGAHPAFVDPAAAGTFRICNRVICGLTISTTVEFGAILLAFGMPDSGALRSFRDGGRALVAHTAVYEAQQLNFQTSAWCPPDFTAMALHRNHATLQMGITRSDFIPTVPIRPPRYQPINFQKRPFPWLLRRAFICGG